MRQGTFHPLSFLDQIFVSWISIKNPNWRWKLASIGLIWNPAKLLSLKKMPLGGAKDEHYSCFHSSCQWVLRLFSKCLVEPFLGPLRSKEVWGWVMRFWPQKVWKVTFWFFGRPQSVKSQHHYIQFVLVCTVMKFLPIVCLRFQQGGR